MSNGELSEQSSAATQRRTISECIALAEQREIERGYAVTLDPDFAEVVEEIVRSRKPWTPPIAAET
jgi:hypothetical protein